MVGEEWQVTYSAQAREAVEVNSQAVQGKVEYITIQSTPTSTELTPGVVYHSLAVTLLTVKPRKFTKGDIVDITATVKNKGGVQDTFKVRITSNDTLLSSQTMTLSSGQLRNVTFSWNTSNVGYAKYKVAVVIDPDEQVWEEDRSDNRAAVMVEVIAPARGGPSFVYFIILLLLILLTIIVVVAVSSVAGSERRPRRLSWLVTRQS